MTSTNSNVTARCGQCEVCGSTTDEKCGFCDAVFYCSKKHRKEHWNEHYADCSSYKKVNSDQFGEHLIATRNIPAGKLIFTDEAIATGPLGTSDLICLSCHSPIIEEKFFKCPDCQWPMCSLECASDKNHDLECDFLSDDKNEIGVPVIKGLTPRYDLILILRCFLLQMRNPAMWNLLNSMASHGDRKKEENDPYQIAAVRFLTEVSKISDDPELVHHIRGVILANAVLIKGPRRSDLRAIYPTVRLMNHSCVPNIHLSPKPDGRIDVRSAIPIKKGEQLLICYTGTDALLWERQSCLLENHYFSCQCKRCTDSSELGTFYSSFKCAYCLDVFLKPLKSDGTLWSCPKCHKDCEVEELNQELDEWNFRLEMNDLFGSGTSVKIAYALANIEQHFHIKHYLWLKAAQLALVKLAYNTSFAAVKLKKYIWENILEIYNILEPGINNKRGMTLYELGKATLSLCTDEFLKQEETSKLQIQNLLHEAYETLKESQNILLIEPSESLENKIANSLFDTFKDIENRIKN